MKKILHALLLFLAIAGYSQETRTITGIILDEADQQPIPGASIFIENNSISNKTSHAGIIQSESIGTTTDFDGKFQLKIGTKVTSLRVTFMGYKSYTLELDGQKNYTVNLKSETAKLQEVVVTGYQKIEKRKLTAAVTKIDMAAIQQTGVSSIDQLLVGQIAGVAVSTPSGAPGAPAKIRIRGTASLNGTQDPLWVLDGLPLESNDVPKNYDKDNIDNLTNYSIAGLNPDDIKDITILKDAAATAIYGARAANGVIIVTTKKGRAGKMVVSFNTNTFITQRPEFSKLNLMNSNEKVDFELGLALRDDLSYRDTSGDIARILNSSNELNAYRNGGFSALSPATQQSINSLRGNNTNWGNLLYQTAINTQHGLSLSGGGEKSDYYFSLGYYDEKGTTVGTGFKRYNLTLKNNYEITDKFKVGIGIFGAENKTTSYLTDVNAQTNIGNYSRNVNPYLTPYNADGSYKYDRDVVGLNGGDYIPFNFLEERENTSNELKTRSVKALLDAEYKVTKDLKVTSQLGLQLDNTSSEKFAGAETYYTRTYKERSRFFSGGKQMYFLPAGGIIQNSNTDFFQYNLKTMVNYSKRIGEKHEIEAMIGNELRRNYNTYVSTKGFGFNDKTLTTQQIVFPNAGFAKESDWNSYTKTKNENAFASFFATAAYTYNKKYNVFGSVRYDGSDLFGVDPKYKYLPLWSTSASWTVSEEDFLKDNLTLSNLRLRASYGLQGNIDKGTSPYVVGSNSTATILPGQTEPTIVVVSPPNEKLRWEKTTNTNVGADIGLFNNRISIVTDYYTRKSTDLIGPRALPLENGYAFTNMNWAQVSNKGYEITLSTRNIDRPNFSWNTSFNFSHNKSNVDRVQVQDNAFLPSLQDRPVNAVFGFKTNGVDENGYPLFVNKKGETVNAQTFFSLYDDLADIVFPGISSDTRLSPAEFRELFTYLGDRDPKFTGGLTNSFKVRNFDLTIAASFNIKQTVTRTPPYNGTQIDRGQNYSRDILDAHSSTNTSSNLPGIVSENGGTGDSWMAYQYFAGKNAIPTMNYLDTWTSEMSYMRLSSVRLGYTFPKTFTDHLNIQSIRFNVEARNLFVISSDYKGYFDPETFGNIYAQPVPKSYTLGCNVTF
ncbi:SusC/RagA family TonB-linked outer membrane protein [Flavobacterium hungaricum]|uniref:SusC/RagA family TonB-linked outer membrane protein n=1 Tax=Flavobacterium hungaricum TaxID=2082725 RepID=A0ABR9TMW2_9FLAO|nr:SusC/RagA family TonB-linked outer membrane protein [Flavobacterium hungaricum]MBE8726691.1 SusC/RagA family TonB-linked outer membrane protein [Flavobacterium hungaricum]